jgi:hypothetical protein
MEIANDAGGQTKKHDFLKKKPYFLKNSTRNLFLFIVNKKPVISLKSRYINNVNHTIN